MKVAVITCYHDPGYVRARSLRAALKLMPGVKPIIVKNRRHGVLRYPEIIWKIWRTKRAQNPDAYLLTFRGQEILPFVLWLAGKKPVIFDEFIIPIAYATTENHSLSFAIVVKHTLAKISEPLYRYWLKKCRFILADTQAHAELSARTSNMNLRKYVVVPVGTDETLFKPGQSSQPEDFTVFYYGNMLPLHGLGTVLEAAEHLKAKSDIRFLIAGGQKPMRQAVEASQSRGANITYLPWIPFEDLPATMRNASLCLGGPFGDTPQAQHVVTGKTYQILACGAPVVVGKSDATAEYFVDKENSLVVSQADENSLARAIAWATKNPKELRVIAENGRKLYEKNFSTVSIAQKLQPIFDALA